MTRHLKSNKYFEVLERKTGSSTVKMTTVLTERRKYKRMKRRNDTAVITLSFEHGIQRKGTFIIRNKDDVRQVHALILALKVEDVP